MAAAAVSLSVAGKKAVQLEPDIIYRIGRKTGLEFYITDESMELAHATISLLRSGVVRLASVVGKVWVNEQEQSFVDLSSRDASDGHSVQLRFGNVEAKLEIVEAQDKSINTTAADSFVIPETEPQSANTTSDSCFIPETQAMPQLLRPSTTGTKRSLGDDFMIPETQDIWPPQPVAETAKVGANNEDECSEMGSQIRICTQDFNDFDEDAIDDFDSSLILGDFPRQILPAASAAPQAKDTPPITDITDAEMSALNWSAINSTKVDQVPAQHDDYVDHDGTRSTPDLFELPVASDDRADTCTPDLFDLPVAPKKSNTPTQPLGGTKQLVVAIIETNKDNIGDGSSNLAKPSNNEPINQDNIETQAFSIEREQEPSLNLPKPSENEPINQDFIETQAFPITSEPKGSPHVSKPSENEPINQDFIETQAFPISKGRESSLNLPKPTDINQDNIETPAFPKPLEMPIENKKSHDDHLVLTSSSICQDFIATQPFPGLQKSSSITYNKENTPLNITHATSPLSMFKTNQDFIATQRFVPTVKIAPIPFDVGDEIDKVLKDMISQKAMSSDEADEEEPIKFFKPCVIEDINHNQKVCQIEGVFTTKETKSRWHLKKNRKCLAKSVSPPPTPSKRSRRLTESPREDLKPEASFKRLLNSLKRAATSKEDSPKTKQIKTRRTSSQVEVESPQAKEPKGREIKAKKQKDIEEQSTSQLKEVIKNDNLPAKEKVLQPSKKSLKRAIASQDDSIEPPKKLTTQKDQEIPEKGNMPERKLRTRGRPCKVECTTGAHSKELKQQKSSSQAKEKIEEAASTSKAPKEAAKSKSETKNKKAKPIEDIKMNEESSQETDTKHRIKSGTKSTPQEKSETKDLQVKDVNEKTKKEELPTISKGRPKAQRGAAKSKSANSTQASQSSAAAEGGIKSTTDRPDISKIKEKTSQVEVFSGRHSGEQKLTPHEKREAKNLQVGDVDVKAKKEELPTTSKGRAKPRKDSAKKTQATSGFSAAAEESINGETPQEMNGKGLKLKVNMRDINIKQKSTPEDKSQAKNKEVEQHSRETKANKIAAKSTLGEKSTPQGKSQTKSRESETAKNEELPATSKRGTRATKEAPKTEPEAKTLTTRRSGATAEPLQSINQYVKGKKAAGKVKIALSMCNLTALEPVIKALKNAIEVTTDPQQCHVLIMDRGERTFKFLMAIAANKPILSTQWLHSLVETRSINVHANHLFRDAKFEEIFQFNPKLVMEKPMILQNIDFMLSEGIQPNETEMKAIIQSAGGRTHTRPPPITLTEPLYVVTNAKQVKRHMRLLRNYDNVKYIKTEGVMQSLLQHNLELLNVFEVKA